MVKEKDKKIVQSASYAYTPYGDGKAGEILYTANGKRRFQIIRLAEFDVTGAYAEQAAKIIDSMNGNFIKERFYAIPLESLPRINSHNQGCRFIIRRTQTDRNSFKAFSRFFERRLFSAV